MSTLQYYTSVPSLGSGARRKWPNLVLRPIERALRVASGRGEGHASLAAPGREGAGGGVLGARANGRVAAGPAAWLGALCTRGRTEAFWLYRGVW
eukprot:CAMPEP_0119544136 /NCGR_PEP_ID=MMETSP1344-20130328/54557_1 /TAXON_ID=236787 /ORGANISM="Florenciella parvula, Strain CCMP2471" /LENGTH=94 /DNA_ID=CAMNT_0007588591 /DNA_START=83 /DNA_END=365 /DNA_ORIENTATION=-